MLLNLLPGLREIRAPLISGYLWLAFFALVLQGELPNADHPGRLQPVFDLGHQFSAFGAAAVLSVAAYLVGSSIQELLRRVGRWVAPRRPLYGEAGSHVSDNGRSDIRHVVSVRLKEMERRLFQVALSPGEGGVDGTPGPETIERELPLIRTLLLGDRPELVGEVDRLQAEADLRITVAIPLAALSIYLAFAAAPTWAAALIPVPLLLIQGYQRQLDAGDLLAKALRIRKANAPTLESLQASVDFVLERIEMEEELGEKMNSGNMMAAFRLGNLQASGEKFEDALKSLQRAADGGVIQAYAEIGLVYEELNDRKSAEQAYMAGEGHRDRKASELLNSMQRQPERGADFTEARAVPDVPAEGDTLASDEQLEGVRVAEYRRRMESGDAKAALNLGLLFDRKGDKEAASEAFQRAVELGPEDADAWVQLGIASYDRADFVDAKEKFEHALELQREQFGSDHVEIGRTLSGLGYVLDDLGSYKEARETEEEALRILERQLGSSNIEVAEALNNLGNVLDSLGEYEAAQDTLRRSLEIKEELLGEDAAEVGLTLNNLGCVLDNLGRYDEAVDVLERALSVNRAQAGDGDGTVASTLDSLGNTRRSLGDMAGSEEAFQRAISIFEDNADPHHTGLSLRGLAQTLLVEGRVADAAKAIGRALEIQESTLEPTHPELARTLDVQADILEAAGEDGSGPRTRARQIRGDEGAAV